MGSRQTVNQQPNADTRQKQISDQAQACPSCGQPMRGGQRKEEAVRRGGFRALEGMGAIITLLGVVSCSAAMSGSGSSALSGVAQAVPWVGLVIFLIGRFAR